MSKLVAEFVQSISDIGKEAWNSCAGTDHPFTRYEFLHALEQTGCATEQTGWLPQHLLVRYEDADTPIAVMPMYLKTHSAGEYVFDHGWADAYERAGGRYYPKLQVSVPFTPVTGPRLLVSDDAQEQDLSYAVTACAVERTKSLGLSSLHLTFLEPDSVEAMERAGLLIRSDQQFHWRNNGYANFGKFLEALSSRKRKQIRKERETAIASGLTLRTLTGNEITEDDWNAFYAFYLDTGMRKWGQPYLNREFFSEIGRTMGEQAVLFLYERDGTPVAGALNFKSADTLYGRYWGCTEHHPCLHFEACYYEAIDYAIAHDLKYVEAGAQGSHKVARGYEPTKTYSAHWIADEGFRAAVERYLTMETREVEMTMAALDDHLPFKKPNSP